MTAPGGTAVSEERLSASEAYCLWAESYDRDANPMLQLEQRWLPPLLPDASGLSVVDVGCGTGRWLAHFASQYPASLIGADSNWAMIARAEDRQIASARLLLADCSALPVECACADLVLASFLASYVQYLRRFAVEMARICRNDAWLFVSDIHPVTERRLNWERAFRVGGRKHTIETRPYEISGLIRHFESAGFELACFLEPMFGAPELLILEQHQKRVVPDTALQPAIYIAGFRKLSSRCVSVNKSLVLLQARVAIGPQEAATSDLRVQEGTIHTMIAAPMPLSKTAVHTLDLTGYLLLPGLINAHDHLEYALFPRMGSGPYKNAKEWADSIYRPDIAPIAEHLKLNKATRLLWGGMHNLLSGVTTVSHHNPFNADVFERDFPVHVIKNFAWSHSLYFDQETITKKKGAHPDRPFIVHVGEGVDDSSAQEIFALAEAGALDSRMVIVHGLALDERGWKLLRESGAALIWCPTSNCFLFGHTHAAEAISGNENVALGSDSPLTAAGNLLDEIHFACHSVGVPAQEIYRQVSSRAAKILRLREGQGHIRVGGVADLLAVRDLGNSPAERLADLSASDVDLVILRGEIQLASAEILERLSGRGSLISGLSPLLAEGRILWVRAPLAGMFDDACSALGADWKLGGKGVRCARVERSA